MFLLSTLALSILGTFACDGLDINSFVTWYDNLYICNTIQNPTMPPSFLFHPWQICKVTKENTSFWLPSFFHRPNVLYLQSYNLPLAWLLQQAHPKSFAIQTNIIVVVNFLTLVLCSFGRLISLVINKSCQ